MASNRPLSLMPTWRHTSNPSVSSPLHNMFPNQGSISAPGSLPLEDTPTRASRSQQQATRPRGESRSSSVPSGLNILPRQCSGATSPGEGLTERKSSVKHLTCFWWKEKGQCRFSDEECLYAHRDTVSAGANLILNLLTLPGTLHGSSSSSHPRRACQSGKIPRSSPAQPRHL